MRDELSPVSHCPQLNGYNAVLHHSCDHCCTITCDCLTRALCGFPLPCTGPGRLQVLPFLDVCVRRFDIEYCMGKTNYLWGEIRFHKMSFVFRTLLRCREVPLCTSHRRTLVRKQDRQTMRRLYWPSNWHPLSVDVKPSVFRLTTLIGVKAENYDIFVMCCKFCFSVANYVFFKKSLFLVEELFLQCILRAFVRAFLYWFLFIRKSPKHFGTFWKVPKNSGEFRTPPREMATVCVHYLVGSTQEWGSTPPCQVFQVSWGRCRLGSCSCLGWWQTELLVNFLLTPGFSTPIGVSDWQSKVIFLTANADRRAVSFTLAE